jgi:hypothetical protein
MVKKAKSGELKKAFETHRQEIFDFSEPICFATAPLLKRV